MSSRATATHALEGQRLIQEKINAPDSLLKLYVIIDEDLKALRRVKQWPRDPRVGSPTLTAAEVLTVLVRGAWRGLKDKATLYFYVQLYHRQEFPASGLNSNLVEATNRYSVKLCARLALMLHCNRQAHGPYPIVRQDSTAIAVCHVWPEPSNIGCFGTGLGSRKMAWASGTASNPTYSVMKRGGSAALI